MRTSFTDAEDKLRVQVAFQFEREGLRITWDYVAGGAVGGGESDGDAITSIGGAANQRSPSNVEDKVLGKGTLVMGPTMKALSVWQSTAGVVRKSVICVSGDEDARSRRWIGPQVHVDIGARGMKTPSGWASEAPPRKKVMIIVGKEVTRGGLAARRVASAARASDMLGAGGDGASLHPTRVTPKSVIRAATKSVDRIAAPYVTSKSVTSVAATKSASHATTKSVASVATSVSSHTKCGTSAAAMSMDRVTKPVTSIAAWSVDSVTAKSSVTSAAANPSSGLATGKSVHTVTARYKHSQSARGIAASPERNKPTTT
ncbi:hypothetical protein JG688_00007831 [Phytophthora aleatoria]|uniref:Uncharacterized protein n=1 Tax=Phytophthora aleatoria TaxID=2496075 RepID=A0A8J5IIX7_9STRA|nr:hypothetical protein JG688_00007831 [Phytophthora aleatoria]